MLVSHISPAAADTSRVAPWLAPPVQPTAVSKSDTSKRREAHQIPRGLDLQDVVFTTVFSPTFAPQNIPNSLVCPFGHRTPALR